MAVLENTIETRWQWNSLLSVLTTLAFQITTTYKQDSFSMEPTKTDSSYQDTFIVEEDVETGDKQALRYYSSPRHNPVLWNLIVAIRETYFGLTWSHRTVREAFVAAYIDMFMLLVVQKNKQECACASNHACENSCSPQDLQGLGYILFYITCIFYIMWVPIRVASTLSFLGTYCCMFCLDPLSIATYKPAGDVVPSVWSPGYYLHYDEWTFVNFWVLHVFLTVCAAFLYCFTSPTPLFDLFKMIK